MAKTLDLKLKEGDSAPDFSALSTDGKQLSLKDFVGKSFVLYFYPKDDTPGCTKEACAFRDSMSEFSAKGLTVLGVSPDSVKAHQKFTNKFSLTFPLLADEGHKIAEAYGVWGEKVFMGRRYMGVNRVTFLIGGDGLIRRIWPKVSPEEHAKEVLAAA